MLNTLIHIFFEVFFIYCALSVLYLFLFSFSGKFFYQKKWNQAGTSPEKRIAILVPAYKEDSIIISTAKSLLGLDYPSALYDIYIITDSFQELTINNLKQLPVQVLEVSFTKSTKTKSLNEAFRRIRKPYDIALICDADNILARDFLKRINSAFANGAKAVQGRRVAKNLDTSFAILDACSEGINNNIFRKGANAIGLSSAVIGSGMAFEYSVSKEIMFEIDAISGFDKILQIKVVQRGIKILYLNDALIFDEKVDSSHAFRQQRKRWISSQFIYLKQFFIPAAKQLLKGNISYFNLAIANNLILPRAFLLLLTPLVVLVTYFINPSLLPAAFGIWFVYLLCLFLALPQELVNKDLAVAIAKLPRAIIVMIGTLFQIKKANKSFIHTVHTKTEINNPLFNEHS